MTKSMKNVSLVSITATVTAFLSLTNAGLAATYDEGINGALSNNHLAPTSFEVSPGSNTIKGQVAANQDYIRFTVPIDSVLSSVELVAYTTSGVSSNVGFFAIAAGESVSVAPPGSNPISGVLGWILFNASDIGPNLLPAMGTAGSGATGFTPPLPAGTYTFWIQDTMQTVGYEFSFDLTPDSGVNAAVAAKQAEVARLEKEFKKAKTAYAKNKSKRNKANLAKAAKKLKAAQAQLLLLQSS
jgi:hypothetical protein